MGAKKLCGDMLVFHHSALYVLEFHYSPWRSMFGLFHPNFYFLFFWHKCIYHAPRNTIKCSIVHLNFFHASWIILSCTSFMVLIFIKRALFLQEPHLNIHFGPPLRLSTYLFPSQWWFYYSSWVIHLIARSVTSCQLLLDIMIPTKILEIGGILPPIFDHRNSIKVSTLFLVLFPKLLELLNSFKFLPQILDPFIFIIVIY